MLNGRIFGEMGGKLDEYANDGYANDEYANDGYANFAISPLRYLAICIIN